MKKIIPIFVIAILVLSGVVFALQKKDPSTSSPIATEQTIPTQILESVETPSPKTTTEEAPQPGKYAVYSADAIASNPGTKLLFFHAPWCPQCRSIESDIKSLGVPSGVTIIKVDYDSNQSLRKKYGVTLQTTFVKVNDSGELVKKYVAYEEPNLASVKRNLLP